MEKKSPDAFRTISEVAEWLDTPPHVLRFWESRFSQIKPVKRAGGRRYYRPADVALLGGIKQLLHDEGMTIRGVQKVLREKGIRHVAQMGSAPAGDEDYDSGEILDAVAVTPPPRPIPVDNVVPMKRPLPEADADTEETPDGGLTEAERADAAGMDEAQPADTAQPPMAKAETAAGEEIGEDAAEEAAPSVGQHEFFFDTPSSAPDAGTAPEEDGTGLSTAEAPEETSELPETTWPMEDADSAAEPWPESAADLPADSQGDSQGVSAPDWQPDAAALAAPDDGLPENIFPSEEAGDDDKEDGGQPPLATRIRALDPAVAGPFRDELAMFSDRLRALRSKMAGHARRAPK